MPSSYKSELVAGLDGCRTGWLCLTKDLRSGFVTARILSDIAEILTLAHRPAIVAVDVPIGLPDSGARICDIQARKPLKAPRASSVFPAPIRPVLGANDYEQACQIGLRCDSRKLSKQAFAILPKIREMDAFLGSDPTISTWVREVHPELCFWAWNRGKSMANGKKSSIGRLEREVLVNSLYQPAYVSAQLTLSRGQYANDDLLDAFAALWTAERAMKA